MTQEAFDYAALKDANLQYFARICVSEMWNAVGDEFIKAFKNCAYNAQLDYINSLWYYSEKEPDSSGYLGALDYKGNFTSFYWNGTGFNDQKCSWKKCVEDKSIEWWCYLSDIIPTDIRS